MYVLRVLVLLLLKHYVTIHALQILFLSITADTDVDKDVNPACGWGVCPSSLASCSYTVTRQQIVCVSVLARLSPYASTIDRLF